LTFTSWLLIFSPLFASSHLFLITLPIKVRLADSDLRQGEKFQINAFNPKNKIGIKLLKQNDANRVETKPELVCEIQIWSEKTKKNKLKN
jgi:hypothetical protein